MAKLGFISLNGKKEKLYCHLQSYCDIETSCHEEFTSENTCDAYFILGEESQLADICNCYMKIAEHISCPVWIYKGNSNENDRLLLYNLGALGVFNEETSQEEIVKAIHNGMVLLEKNIDAKSKEVVNSNEKQFKLVGENLCVLLDNNQSVYLTKLEYKALSILYSASPRAVSYKEMYEEIWGAPYNDQNYRIANIIFHLRVKLEKNVRAPKFVKTVRSNGYLFNNDYK